jgi:RNA recognition motif-containing protein
MKIIVLNLPRTTTQDDLFTLFKVHGSIQSCAIVMDKSTGRSKGFGFVEMPDSHHAAAAIKGLNGHLLGKNKLRVKNADQ